MKIEARLSKIGGQFERAQMKQDFATMIKLEKEMDEIYNSVDFWITPYVVRGRNVIRRAHKMDEIHA